MSKNVALPTKWQELKKLTKARVALGNVGTGLPLNDVLALKHAHALAKDAIVTKLNLKLLTKKCLPYNILCQVFNSEVNDRFEYLKRPDLGRKLAKSKDYKKVEKVDILFVLTDGLSAKAVNKNAFQVLDNVLTELNKNYAIGIACVEQGRVAVGDAVAEWYDADFVAVLIGERPGLSSPESMGIYTTYNPKIGLTDERRNCISNIHADGLNGKQAAELLKYLIQKSFALKLSGVGLKVEIGEILDT